MFSVTFPANVNEASFNISIVNDVIAECMENFTLKLEVPSEEAAKGVRLGSPDTAIVNIMDDDGECCVFGKWVKYVNVQEVGAACVCSGSGRSM